MFPSSFSAPMYRDEPGEPRKIVRKGLLETDGERMGPGLA